MFTKSYFLITPERVIIINYIPKEKRKTVKTINQLIFVRRELIVNDRESLSRDELPIA